jgi:hypothetical protein
MYIIFAGEILISHISIEALKKKPVHVELLNISTIAQFFKQKSS